MSDRPADPPPPPDIVLRYATGWPDGADEPEGQRPYATWGEAGTLLVVTWGSSRCPQLPISVEVSDAHTVIIRTELYRPGGPCPRDFVPTTGIVAIPDGLERTATVRVRVDDVETVLAPR